MADRRYITAGPLRGKCGHQHKSLYQAVDCLDADEAVCAANGTHTDRRILAIGPGLKRELNELELAAVKVYRSRPAKAD